MKTLKQAQANTDEMEKFIRERRDIMVESTDFDKVLKSMSLQGKPKAIQATSSKDDSDDYT